jgi:hypothetical protein
MVDGLVLLADGDAVGAAGPRRQAVHGWPGLAPAAESSQAMVRVAGGRPSELNAQTCAAASELSPVARR